MGKVANIYIDNNFLFSATIGQKSRIRLTKKSDIGIELAKAVVTEAMIKILV